MGDLGAGIAGQGLPGGGGGGGGRIRAAAEQRADAGDHLGIGFGARITVRLMGVENESAVGRGVWRVVGGERQVEVAFVAGGGRGGIQQVVGHGRVPRD